MDYDKETNEDIESTPGSTRAVEGVSPNKPVWRVKTSMNDRQIQRIKAWEIQKAAQLGRKWNYNLKVEMLQNAVAKCDLDLAAAGSDFSVYLQSAGKDFFIVLKETSTGRQVAKSSTVFIKDFDPRDAESMIKDFLKKYGVG